MQTTEIFVEQVLIGLLVLITAGLFIGWRPEFNGNGNDIETSILILGGSYFIGILYDRFADTLLQNLEQHSRLAIAIKRIKDQEVEGPEYGIDPFPEEQLRISIMRDRSGLTEYAGYLRSRIRLSRAMTTIFPALSVGYSVQLLRDSRSGAGTWQYAWAAVTVVYVSVFLLNVLNIPEQLPKTSEATRVAQDPKWRFPAVHRPRKSFDAYRVYRQDHSQKSFAWQWQIAIWEPTVWAVIVLFIVAIFMVSTLHETKLLALPFGGLIATWLSGWVWYRIESTRLTLLRAYANEITKESSISVRPEQKRPL